MEVDTNTAKFNEKFIHILVFKCEADWSFAMNMKQAMSKQESNAKQEESKAGLKNQSLLNQKDSNLSRNTFRLRAHSLKRFMAAYKSVTKIEKLLDQETIFD